MLWAYVLLGSCMIFLMIKKALQQLRIQGQNQDGNTGGERGQRLEAPAATTVGTGGNFDVFLSHRGQDDATKSNIKKTFAGSLAVGLREAGLNPFLDEYSLKPSQRDAWAAIKRSLTTCRLVIVVLSPGFGNSIWCLDELAMAVEQMNRIPLLPVWLPDDQRPSKESIIEQLTANARRLRARGAASAQQLARWTSAASKLSDVTAIRLDQHEGRYDLAIAGVVENAGRIIGVPALRVAEHPVGMEGRVEALLPQVKQAAVLCLHGMGGVGKTSLAKAAYNRLRGSYSKGSNQGMTAHAYVEVGSAVQHPAQLLQLQQSLLRQLTGDEENVPHVEAGIEKLARWRNEKRSILLVMDDVWSSRQVAALLSPLLPTSRDSSIIVTTRDADLLRQAAVADVSLVPVSTLEQGEAHELFCRHAFQQKDPLPDWQQLVQQVVDACGGLPLSLKVIGSALFQEKEQSKWATVLEQLKQARPAGGTNYDELFWKLKVSYDMLEDQLKPVFLDVACLLLNQPMCIDPWGPGSQADLDRLQHLSLVEVDSQVTSQSSYPPFQKHQCAMFLRMHDQLRDLAYKLVRQQAQTTGFSRVWDMETAADAFDNNEAHRTLQGFRLSSWDAKALCKKPWPRLRLMVIGLDDADPFSQAATPGETSAALNLPTPLHKLEAIWASGQGGLEISGKFAPRRGLHSASSHGQAPASMSCLARLQVLTLSHCNLITALPEELGLCTQLEVLRLDTCRSLIRLPESVGNLTRITSIHLRKCSSIAELPETITALHLLRLLDLTGAKGLKHLPESMGQLMALQAVGLRRCSSLECLPACIGLLTNLQHLDLYKCSSLQYLPESIAALINLPHLDLYNCGSLQRLSESTSQLTGLHELDLFNCSSLRCLPESIGQLKGLQSLQLFYCSSLQSLPESIGQSAGLQQLNLYQCSSLQSLPESIGQLTGLPLLDLSRCSSLQSLPGSIGQLARLLQLDLSHCSSLQSLPESIGHLTGLQTLDLSYCHSLQGLLESIGQLTALQHLDLSYCGSLLDLPETVGQMTALQHLSLAGCCSLQSLPESLSQLTALQHLDLSGCSSLKGLPESLGQLTALQHVNLSGQTHKLRKQWQSLGCKLLRKGDCWQASAASAGQRLHWKVFISHRDREAEGPTNIKHIFVSFLRARLEQAGVTCFMQERSLEPGHPAFNTILEDVQQCSIAIPILSKGYGNSVCCLRELTAMVEAGRHIIPLYLDPAGVRMLEKIRADSWKVRVHAEPGELKRWQEAIRAMGALTGWREDQFSGYQASLVGSIVAHVVNQLGPQSPPFSSL